MADNNVPIYIEQGGERQVIGSGASMDVESGGELDIESGASFKLAAVAVTATAAELNEADLSVVGIVRKAKRINITTPPDGSEVDSTWDLPALAIVRDVFLDVTTAEATGGTKTLDIGTDGAGSNDPDGFADALSVASLGIIRPGVAIDGGGNFYDTNTRGALLSSFVQGTNADDRGLYNEFPDVTSGGESITWTAGSADFAELVADLYIIYDEFIVTV